jgi:predicted DNA binding CopG/RHH family protein
MRKQASKPKNWTRYYDDRDILDEITDESVDMILDEHLRDDILSGKRKRKLKNVTIKVDPLQVKAIKKLSTMKSVPYQTLIRIGSQRVSNRRLTRCLNRFYIEFYHLIVSLRVDGLRLGCPEMLFRRLQTAASKNTLYL